LSSNWTEEVAQEDFASLSREWFYLAGNRCAPLVRYFIDGAVERLCFSSNTPAGIRRRAF
jgi:hypothetical protein